MEKAMISLFALMGLSFIGMAVAIVFDKPRLIDFFLLDVYGAWSGARCVVFYRNVIKIIRYRKYRKYGKYGTFIQRAGNEGNGESDRTTGIYGAV